TGNVWAAADSSGNQMYLTGFTQSAVPAGLPDDGQVATVTQLASGATALWLFFASTTGTSIAFLVIPTVTGGGSAPAMPVGATLLCAASLLGLGAFLIYRPRCLKLPRAT